MPLSNVLGAQSIIRAGVCTSSTRPASPFEGQLIYETDTDLVLSYNGSSWVSVGASAGGLVRLSGETAFSAVSSVTLDSVFTSTYRNYKIIVNYTTSSHGMRFRVRAGGSSVTTTTYNDQYLDGNNASVSASRSTSATSVFVAAQTAGTFNAAVEINIYGIQVATPTVISSLNITHNTAYTSPIVTFCGGNNTNATSYDGFELFTSSGTTSGTYTVYGLATS